MALTGVYRHTWTAEQDAALVDVYRDYRHGRIKCLSIDWGIPANTLSNRAKTLGLSMTRPRPTTMRRWTETEDQIIIKFGYLPAGQIQTRLKDAGFQRGRNSIDNRRILLRQQGRPIGIERPGMTVEEVAAGLGCSEGVVCIWIRRGLLKAKPTTDNPRNKRHVILHDDLRAFCRKNPACLINCKPDLVWYTDLISHEIRG